MQVPSVGGQVGFSVLPWLIGGYGYCGEEKQDTSDKRERGSEFHGYINGLLSVALKNMREEVPNGNKHATNICHQQVSHVHAVVGVEVLLATSAVVAYRCTLRV